MKDTPRSLSRSSPLWRRAASTRRATLWISAALALLCGCGRESGPSDPEPPPPREATWIPFESSPAEGPIYGLASIAGTLFVHGVDLHDSDSNTGHVVAWDGSRWGELETGSGQTVTGLGEYEGSIVAGSFGDVRLQMKGGGWISMGRLEIDPPFAPAARAFASFRGDLIVAGAFQTIGGLPAGSIARWDGVQWHAMGAGTNGQVNTLTVFEDNLYAGGFFARADGHLVLSFAKWDGAPWYGLPEGLYGLVYDSTVFQGKLVVAGTFGTSQSGSPLNHVAWWDEDHWSDFGGGVNGPVYALAVYHDRLIAGGGFVQIRFLPANHIAARDEAGWSPLAEGTNRAVSDLVVHQDTLVVAGNFTTAGPDTTRYLARWVD